MHLPHHTPSANAHHLGALDTGNIINVLISLRRKPDHDAIPDFDSYIGCPPRPRLSESDFARRYGASIDDVAAITQHYQAYGLNVTAHLARKHVYLLGNVGQFNNAFGISLQAYEKYRGSEVHPFHTHPTPATVPDHLAHMILSVSKLNTEPHLKPAAYPVPPVNSNLTVPQVATIYNSVSASGAGQIIAIPIHSGWGPYSSSDLQSTCNMYGIAMPTVTTITLDSINAGSTDLETQLDVSMCVAFSGGCKIVMYQCVGDDEFIARVTHPNSGEAQCNIMSLSSCSPEFTSSINVSAEDAAIQGLTIFAASGDWGITSGLSGTASNSATVTACYPAVNSYVCGVGGTALGCNSGTISTSNFIEYYANVNRGYYVVGGGGVSVEFAQPSYQANCNVPATLTPTTGLLHGTPGRGVPDIASVMGTGIEYYFGGSVSAGNGTSQATPTMAGMFARVNGALGRNIGFINPTLYVAANTAFIRRPSSGGPSDSTMVVQDSQSNVSTYVGYPNTAGFWNCCTGLGMVNMGAFVAYVQAHGLVVDVPSSAQQNYWMQIVAVNSAGTAASTFGPYLVTNPVTP
jgi:subtilase family serine protease